MTEPTENQRSEENGVEGVLRGWERPRVLDALALDAHAIIEASAGTGKTYTLEHLVLELVAAGAPIEEILVVTFTDKATREMKLRVRKRLAAARESLEAQHAASRARGQSPPEASVAVASRLATALAGFDRAAISTIHSFCQRALTEHAFASGRPFVFERADGREGFGRALRQAVRSGLAGGDQAPVGGVALRSALAALSHGAGGAVARLEALLYGWMREPGEARPAFSPREAARALLATPTATELLESRWAQWLAQVPSLTARARVRDALFELATGLEPHRARLQARLDAVASRDATGDTVGDGLTRDGETRTIDTEGDALCDSLAWGPALAWAAGSTDPRGVESNAALCANHLALVAEAPSDTGGPSIAGVFATLHRQLGSPVPFLLRAVLPRVLALWAQQKRDTSTLDFDDMLTALRDAVVGQPAVRAALRARYRHALVDEFQDTDEVQWEIFRRLFVERDDDGSSDPQRAHTLIVIGDVKQAIYGFRSADVHTFEDACRTLERHGARRAVLDQSYRSSAAMLEGLDSILGPAGSADDETSGDGLHDGLAGYTQPLGAGLPERRALTPSGQEAPAIVVQHLVGTPELRLPLIRRALAEAIAKEVQALVGGALQLRDQDAQVPRAVRLSEIFVLTRSVAEGQDVAEAFRRHGVPHAFFKQDGLFRTREAQEVLEVLRAVSARHDRNLTTRALLGPFFGVPLRSLAAAHAIDAGHPLSLRLSRWASLAEQGRLAALFSAMLEGADASGSGLTRRELYLHQGERALVNYRHLFELLLELATARRLHVGELALELSRRIDRAHSERVGADDEDVQKLESERDAVQILTMHKSKGLEAEVVFVFGGMGKPPKRRLAPRVVHERRPGEVRARRVAYALADDGMAERAVSVDVDGSGRPLPLNEALRAEAQAEDERLYYVAMTRAKRRLYLPYFGPPPPPLPRRDDVTYDPPHLKGSYRVLNERLRALGEAGALGRAPFAIETVNVGPRVRVRAGAVSLPEQDASARTEIPRLSSAERARLAGRLVGFEVTSYTRMRALAKSRRDTGEAEGSVELSPSLALLSGEMPLEAPGARGPGGARFGVLVHGVLEDLLLAPMPVVAPTAPPSAAPVPNERVPNALEPNTLEPNTLEPTALESTALEHAVATHPRVQERMKAHGASDEEQALAVTLAARALHTPIDTELLRLPQGLGALGRRAVEMPFLFPVPERAHPPLGATALGATALGSTAQGWVVERGFVRGVIDLLFEHEGQRFVLDWKTDRLAHYDVASLAAHVAEGYQLQIALYTLAVFRAFAREHEGRDIASLYTLFGGLVYVFVRGLDEGGAGVLTLRPSLAQVLAWEDEAREGEGLLGCPLPQRRAPLAPLVVPQEEP